MRRWQAVWGVACVLQVWACGPSVEESSGGEEPVEHMDGVRQEEPGEVMMPVMEPEQMEPEVMPPLEEEPMPEPEEPTPEEPEPEEPEVGGCSVGESDCIEVFPAQVRGTTVGGVSERDRYACAPETDESGPERVYRVVLSEPGFLVARLAEQSEGVDVDVHILQQEGAESCLDRGHFAAGAYLEAGEYWLVADSWVNELGEVMSGEFELSVNLVQPGDFMAMGMNEVFAQDAFSALVSAWSKEDTRRLEYVMTDFSIHSSKERAWLVDLATGEQLFHVPIGHGINSVEGDDRGVATDFSNESGSYKSSLGVMLAAETYVGDFGYSLRLDGLEEGINDRVRSRAIVVHPDERNRPEVTAEQGYLTPSRGCPTLDPAISREFIDTIAQGALMFFWAPDEAWREASEYL